MLKELGLPHKTSEEMRKHVGYGEIPLLYRRDRFKRSRAPQESLGDLRAQLSLQEASRPFPCIRTCREFLEEFRDKPKIIISNKKYDFIMEILKNHGLTGYFDEVYGGDTSPCLKPDPCLIKGIIEKRGVDKRRVLFVGDMTVDIETGRNAGVMTCAVTYGFDERKKAGET